MADGKPTTMFLDFDRPCSSPACPACATLLNEQILYLGDNGRATCGRLKCAGMTSYFSGRDRSGQPLVPVDARAATDHGLTCEGCGMTPRLVVLA